MRKIINGKLYDTETAQHIGRREFGAGGDFSHFTETLYRKKTGELFIVGEGGPMTCYGESKGENCWGFGERIIPGSDFGEDELKKWVDENCDVDTYIWLFGPVEE